MNPLSYMHDQLVRDADDHDHSVHLPGAARLQLNTDDCYTDGLVFYSGAYHYSVAVHSNTDADGCCLNNVAVYKDWTQLGLVVDQVYNDERQAVVSSTVYAFADACF